QVLKARATWTQLTDEGKKEYSKGYVAATKHYPGLSAVGVYGAGVPEGMECLMQLYDIYSNSNNQAPKELSIPRNTDINPSGVVEGVQYTPQSRDCVAAILNGQEDKFRATIEQKDLDDMGRDGLVSCGVLDVCCAAMKIEGGLDPALEFVTILRTQAFDKLTRTWESSTAPPMTQEDWVAYSTYCSTYDRLAER
ncbi:hypothetical protein HaLaN_28221, partial [Haematococcus lacustris]